LKGSTPK